MATQTQFENGQKVSVLLNLEHGLPGERRPHAATFLGYHTSDKEWADVELEKDHAGSDLRHEHEQHKRRHLSVPVSAIRALLALFALLGLASASPAQFIGYTSPQTVDQTLASNLACTGGVQNFTITNLGQTQH